MMVRELTIAITMAIAFSVLSTLGHLALYQKLPRW